MKTKNANERSGEYSSKYSIQLRVLELVLHFHFSDVQLFFFLKLNFDLEYKEQNLIETLIL